MELTIELIEGKTIALEERHLAIEEMERIVDWFENETTAVIKYNNNSTNTTNYISRNGIIMIVQK
ncbi:hypothetical protein [Sporosalibacterium faouarense]|uniref:hypothetical protein n=1 Tax=Sporosalibacterium faouarense TaxID=516123 RepID=UPI00192C7240|nr:hypothetical protein [Sporosalibacterium faouarense]